MRPEAEYQQALELIRAGVNDCEIGRRLDILRGTIRDWRVGMEARSGGRTKEWSGRRHGTCFRCDGGWVDEEAYAYLLGAYLGDGCLSLHPREVYRLRIICDLTYPNIINEIAAHMVIREMRSSDSLPGRAVSRSRPSGSTGFPSSPSMVGAESMSAQSSCSHGNGRWWILMPKH